MKTNDKKDLYIKLSNENIERLTKYRETTASGKWKAIDEAITKYLDKAIDLYYEDLKQGISTEIKDKKVVHCQISPSNRERVDKINNKYVIGPIIDRALNLFFETL